MSWFWIMFKAIKILRGYLSTVRYLNSNEVFFLLAVWWKLFEELEIRTSTCKQSENRFRGIDPASIGEKSHLPDVGHIINK